MEKHIRRLKKQTEPVWSSQKLKFALWTLERVQVATWSFWHFDYRNCLQLLYTLCLWLYFVEWVHKTQKSSHFHISESGSCKIWILDWLKITIHKRKAYLRPRDLTPNKAVKTNLQKVHVDTCTRASGHFIKIDKFLHKSVPQHVYMSLEQLEHSFTQ